MSLHENAAYQQMIQKFLPKSPCLKNCAFAFLFGGLICFLSQWLFFLYVHFLSDEELAGTLVTVTLIFLASLLTAIGVCDRIAKRAGAGTLLPVTGFANATVSPSMDAKSEGFVLGVGSKVFTVSGPVIFYGTLSSILFGVIFYMASLF